MFLAGAEYELSSLSTKQAYPFSVTLTTVISPTHVTIPIKDPSFAFTVLPIKNSASE